MTSLSPTARVILGLLARGARTGYEIKQITDRSTRFFWGASYGQIYPELRRLEAGGLVRSFDEPRGKVRRRAHVLTAAGESALHDWLREETDILEIRNEGLLRLFFGALLEPSELDALAERRARWFEEAAGLFRSIGRELGPTDDPSGEVLLYGIEAMEWNAVWWAEARGRLARRGGSGAGGTESSEAGRAE